MKPGSLAYKIFIDRFALKDLSRENLRVGDMVVVQTNPGSHIGGVRSLYKNDKVSVQLEGSEELKEYHIDQVDKPLETTYDECCYRVAHTVAKGDETLAASFEELLGTKQFVPAGRILAGAGSGINTTWANCFVINSPKDSREGIYASCLEWSEIMSRGGGVGANFSTLRPKGALVKGVNGRSSGSVSWMEMFSLATKTITQGGSRNGAGIIVLEDWHPDILDFIRVKKDMTKLTGLNISVAISDKFMEAVKSDAEWTLLFPDTQFENYNTYWDGNIDKWLESNYPVIEYHKCKAKDIWDEICKAAHASAEPGLFFIERYNKMSNSYYFNRIISPNPCQPGFAEVLTAKSEIKQFKDLKIGDKIWSQDQIVTVVNKVRSGVQPVYKYITTTGSFIGTDKHKVVSKGTKIEVKDVKTIDVLQGPSVEATINLDDVVDGVVLGDGTHHGDNVLLVIGEDDKDYFVCLKDYIGDVYSKYNTHKVNTTIKLEEVCLTYDRTIPDRFYYGNVNIKCGFLRGLYTANGSVVGKDNSRVTLKQSSFTMIQQVQQMLSSLGIFSYWTKNVGKTVKFSNGEYVCKDSYDLNIGRHTDKLKFIKLIGFVQDYKNSKLEESLVGKTNSNHYKSSYEIKEIQSLGEFEVFDITVDGPSHTYWSGGLNVSNCGEIGLPSDGICNLGHLNLTKFINKDFKQFPDKEIDYNYRGNDEHGYTLRDLIDYDELSRSVFLAVEFLDNCLDISYQPFQGIKDRIMQERRIGLGTLGLGELLIKLGIRYGSSQAVAFCSELYRTIMHAAYAASNKLSLKKGAFKAYDRDKHNQSGFIQANGLNGYNHMRNVCLLTQAPTGTVGTMMETSTGIEPYFAFIWERTSRIGVDIEKANVVEDYEKATGIKVTSNKQLPSYFVNAMDNSISVDDHINMQAVIQKYVDQSISKTINVPEHYTVDQVADAYMKLYDSGCKGGTVYRDNSRNEQVLRTLPEPIPTTPAVTTPEIKKRPRIRDAKVISVNTAMGTAHVTLTNDIEGSPLEVFIDVGKGGSDIKALSEAFGRLISLLLRIPSTLSSSDRLKEVVRQLKNIGGARPQGFGKNKSKSLPDSIAKALEELTELEATGELTEVISSVILEEVTVTNADLCPACGDTALIQTEGCETCISCGNSMCG